MYAMQTSREKFKKENLLQKCNMQLFSKENKTEQGASSCTTRICLHRQNFPLSPRNVTEQKMDTTPAALHCYTNKKSYSNRFNRYL